MPIQLAVDPVVGCNLCTAKSVILTDSRVACLRAEHQVRSVCCSEA